MCLNNLDEYPNVDSLCFHEEKRGQLDLTKIVIASWKNITNLNFYGCFLPETSAPLLLKLFQSLRLTQLNLNTNKIDKGIRLLCDEYFGVCKTLRCLCLRDTGISEKEDGIAVLNVIKRSKSLLMLDFRLNSLHFLPSSDQAELQRLLLSNLQENDVLTDLRLNRGFRLMFQCKKAFRNVACCKYQDLYRCCKREFDLAQKNIALTKVCDWGGPFLDCFTERNVHFAAKGIRKYLQKSILPFLSLLLPFYVMLDILNAVLFVEQTAVREGMRIGMERISNNRIGVKVNLLRRLLERTTRIKENRQGVA